VLRLPDEGRSPQDLARTLIDTPAGRIPVSAIATVSETDGPNQIGRENGRRRIVVYANTDGSDMSRIVRDIRAAIDRTQLPTGNSISGRSVPGSGAGYAKIAWLSLMSLALVFLVLYTLPLHDAGLDHHGQYPLALVGSVIAMWLSGSRSPWPPWWASLP
jgi:HME family heavy-metal exporter